MKVLIAIFLLLSALVARENPFFPTEGEKELPFTSNDVKNLPALQRASISLPSKARVLESVSVKYKNLDGSTESKTIEVENTIDWHLPIFVTQSYPSSNTQEIKSEKREEVKQAKEIKNKQGLEKIASIAYADFYTSGKSLQVNTKDELMRNFLLSHPHRIVLDFKRDANIKAYTKEISQNIFSKIRVGNHSGYYRVVIELDGYYRYTLANTNTGYTITLR
ncbi:MAG TPA: AMIN domain-containing protein [Sulfurimonas sp. UBA12504]|nr:MAG: AMIN domain-containing protein [Sulfurimonas sp. GWF2_37_8]DAB30517.1 MAG TPA: AMIN domain-containing protein [Sulfurimonas sp. UBA12504]